LLIGPGEHAIEKMCVTNVALMQEYGNQVPLEGCTLANRDRVRFCVCDTNDCNRAPLNEQMVIQQPNIFTSTSSTFRPPGSANAIVPSISRQYRCEVCSENDVTDSTTDCRRAFPYDCSQHYTNQPVFCMIRQTQLQEGLFNLEKRCITRGDFEQNFPGTQMRVGCASAFDGSVSFCICDGDLCNRGSLFHQAQRLTGDDRPNLPGFLTSTSSSSSAIHTFPISSTTPHILTSTATLPRGGNQQPFSTYVTNHPHNSLAIDEESHQLLRPTTLRPMTTTGPRPVPIPPSTRPTPEEFLLNQRVQQRWQDDDSNNNVVVSAPDSASRSICFSVLSVICAALLFR